MIEIRNLTKSFDKKVILNDINLSLSAGKVYGIMGENGAGKTTLFQCMLIFINSQGSVLLPKHITIGYLPDIPFFYTFVTGKEFLYFCIKVRGLEVIPEEIEKLNKIFLLPLNDYATRYSMGMKKKLYLMALVLQHSEFYILDEPFNGLDLSGTIFLKRWLLNTKSESKTVLLSSHIISVLTDVCDEIYFLHEGSIKQTYIDKSTLEIENDIMN